MRLIVQGTAQRDTKIVLLGNILCGDMDEPAREVRRILGCGAFYDHQVINLAGRNQIEGKSAAIRFAPRHGGSVHPYIIVALRQPAHHYVLAVHQRDTGNSLDYFGGIIIYRAFNLLRGNTARNHRIGA